MNAPASDPQPAFSDGDGTPPSGGRVVVITFALWALACILAFVAAEVALAIYTPFEVIVKGDRIVLPANRHLVFNNDGSSRGLTSSEWISSKLDPVIVHDKNSLGFRGAEPPPDFGDRLTIVTVGGSTTECFYLSEGRTWPDRLSAQLSSALSPLWLNNAGLDGHSTFGHLVLMEDHIVPLRPKVVLFLIGINDVHADQPLDTDRRVQRAGFDLRSPKAFLISAANYSRVFALGLNLYRNWRAKVIGLNYNQDFDLRTVGSRAVSDAAWGDLRGRYQDGTVAFRGRLLRLVQMARTSGIEPVFITQPAIYGIGKDDLTGVDLETMAVQDVNGRLAWRLLEMFNDVTRSVAAEQGVLLVDLAKELPKSSRYFYDFYHYTNDGAAKVAAIVYQSLCPSLEAEYPAYAHAPCEGVSAAR